MPEMPSSLPKEQPNSPSESVDTPLEFPATPNASKRGYDATVPQELRERLDTAPEGELAREINKQKEYAQMAQLYAELQETVKQETIPDDYRKGLPQAVEVLIDELIPAFRALSLYHSSTEKQVKRELEGMVRRQELTDKVTEYQGLFVISKGRVEDLKAALIPVQKSGISPQDEAKAAKILADMKRRKEFKSMPEIGQVTETKPDSEAPKGVMAGLKRLFGRK